MARRLIVVLGAGASYDCASPNVRRDDNVKPPLVTGLFDGRFASILAEYPRAQQIAPDVRVATESGAVALETYLREELRDSPFPHLRLRYQAIPLYLQHLFWHIGTNYTDHPDNYDRLISESLRLDSVNFVTLNYDTILDRRLAIDSPITDMASYVSTSRKWSLIKLHGSVDWGRSVLNGPYIEHRYMPRQGLERTRTYASEFAELGEAIDLDNRVVLRRGSSLTDLRTTADYVSAGFLFYPAVAVPLGSEDEVICPDSHIEHVREHQRDSPNGLNVLVIGYSGLDEQLLRLLAWGERPVQTIKVINGAFEQSYATVQIMAERLRFQPTEDMAFNGGFNEFAQTDAMSLF